MGVLGLATLLLAADHLLLAGASEALHQHICKPVESLAARLGAEAYSRHLRSDGPMDLRSVLWPRPASSSLRCSSSGSINVLRMMRARRVPPRATFLCVAPFGINAPAGSASGLRLERTILLALLGDLRQGS